MKSDQMGTGHNNPSPRELPLSNQARFSSIFLAAPDSGAGEVTHQVSVTQDMASSFGTYSGETVELSCRRCISCVIFRSERAFRTYKSSRLVPRKADLSRGLAGPGRCGNLNRPKPRLGTTPMRSGGRPRARPSRAQTYL